MGSWVSSPVFVGRRQEVERLSRAIEAARGGTPAIFYVGGEAGVGKTRFVDEVCHAAAAGGAHVLLGGCIDLGGESLPFAPIVEALRGIAAEFGDDRLAEIAGGGAELARLLPGYGGSIDASPSVGLSYASAQSRFFELLLGLLTRLGGADGPVVLVVEDIHWADRSTLDLLAFLTRNLRHGAVVLIATYRTDELHRRHPLLPFLAEIERGRRAERISLRRFSRPEVSAQLAAILGGQPDRELFDTIYRRSEGNPFFAEELLAASGAGRLSPIGDGSTRGGADDERTGPRPSSRTLPDTLREVLLARIAGLPERTQELLRDAAAGGREISVPLLAAVTGLDEGELTDGLREAVQRQILVPIDDRGEERYAFRHALAQEAIYGELMPGERPRLHASFARALEQGQGSAGAAGGDPSIAAALAYHWYAAHDLPRALTASVRAGATAESVLAYAEAQALYERALELWDGVPDAESAAGIDRIELHERAARTAAHTALPRALEHLRSALARVDSGAEPARAARLRADFAAYVWESGDGKAALGAMEEALALVPPETPGPDRARALARLGQFLMLAGRFRDSAEACAQAIEIAQSIGERAVEAHALNTLGVAEAYVGARDGGLAHIRRSLEIAREIDSPDDIVRSYNNLAALRMSAGAYDEAIAASRQCHLEAERLGLRRFFGPQSHCEIGSALYFLGRWTEARREFDEVLAGEPDGMSAAYVLECCGTIEASTGRFDEARRHLAAAERLVENAMDPEYTAPVAQARAELELWEGRPDAALEIVTRGLEAVGEAQEIGISWVGPLYAAGLRAAADLAGRSRDRRESPGHDDLARGWLDAMRATAARFRRENPVFAPLAEAHLDLAEAEWSRYRATPDPAAWETSAAAWAALSMPYPRAYSLWRSAEAALAAGREGRAGAAIALREARAIGEALGAEPLCREIEALAARARIGFSPEPDLVAVGPGRPDETAGGASETLGLTARELEVLRLVADGRTNRQIGEALFISEKTAGVHVSNILGKLGVASRTEAAATAHRAGLLGQTVTPGATRGGEP